MWRSTGTSARQRRICVEDEFTVILTKNPHPVFYFYHNLYTQNLYNTKVLTVMLFCMLTTWDKTVHMVRARKARNMGAYHSLSHCF